MTDRADSVIETTGLVKDHHIQIFGKRKHVRVLDGLTIKVSAGQTFGLLGLNGAGKTTTLRLLLGLLRPTSGSVSVLGMPPGDHGALQRIGYLPENPNFYKHLSALEVLEFFARLFDMPTSERRNRIVELLNLVSLQDQGCKPISAFSKGMLQRLALAQCLLNDPEVIFLDEPNSGLDPLGRRDMRIILQKLKEKGKTIFLNSHLLPDVNDLCDRIGILHQGKLAAQGKREEISSTGSYLELEEFFMEHTGIGKSGGNCR